MEFTSQNDYDDYAFWVLLFVCDDCQTMIEPPEDYDDDLGEEYQYYIARKAESAEWYISLNNNMTCYCPDCRKKRGL
jgi:hypothetical protein